MPEEFKFKEGEEHPLAGRCDFYRLAYGPYLIGMNASAVRNYPLAVPEKGRYRQLPDGQEVKPGAAIPVTPKSTVVLKRISE